LTGKCFPLTNFPNDKQTHESLESGFPETTFQETNALLVLFFKMSSINVFFTLQYLARKIDWSREIIVFLDLILDSWTHVDMFWVEKLIYWDTKIVY
jgi:hypothetical protein